MDLPTANMNISEVIASMSTGSFPPVGRIDLPVWLHASLGFTCVDGLYNLLSAPSVGSMGLDGANFPFKTELPMPVGHT